MKNLTKKPYWLMLSAVLASPILAWPGLPKRFDQGVGVVGAFVADQIVETLVATRGPNFPFSRLESRLMCPACGNRRVP
jgi:hypothetical protein